MIRAIIKPVRIQRKRIAGYSMQAVSRAANGLDCISVTRPGRWGNPYDIRRFGRELSLALFRNTMSGIWSPSLLEGKSDELYDLAYNERSRFLERLDHHHPIEIVGPELRGCNLACFCSPLDACHADILLELANPEREMP